MKKKNCLFFILMLLASGMKGEDGVEYLKSFLETVTITSTNLALKYKSNVTSIRIVLFNLGEPEIIRSIHDSTQFRMLERNEEFVVTPNRKTILTDSYHGATMFVPVFFKDQKKGFQIVKRVNWGGVEKTNIMYIALSDVPIRVGEEDVLREITKEDLEREKAEAMQNAEPQPIIEEIEKKEEVVAPSRPRTMPILLAALAFLAVCGTAYFFRKRRKR